MGTGRKNIRKRKTGPVFVAVALTILAIALLLLYVGAQTTYIITDKSRVLVHRTVEANPAAVLEAAGLELDAGDTYATYSDGGVSQIHVRRGQRITVDYFGDKLEAVSSGESVEELLARLGLTWSEADMLSASPQEQTYDGMELTVAHVIQEKQTYTTVLPHETIHCTDPALPEGTQKTVTEGENGQLLCQAAVTYRNGVETERQILSQQVISQPVSEIVAVGSGPAQEEKEQQAIVGDGIITLPTGEVLTYTEKVTCLATAYTCEGYVGTTATGTRARVGAIAVDPEVFPYGTRFYIATRDGAYVYGVATAEDCGSKQFIYGTRLDLYFDTRDECVQFGARSCDVYVLG